jgi:hypothetical protein
MQTSFIRPRGFSLMEAMVTLVVMLLIIGGATAIFVQNQRATTAHITLAMLRANLRFAMETMSADLRPIGAYSRTVTPVVNRTTLFPLVDLKNSGTYTAGFGQYSAYDPSLPDRIRLIEPDIINDAELYVDYDHSSELKSVKVTGNQFNDCDILLITNANLVEDPFDPNGGATADLFQACNVQQPGSGNPFTEVTFGQGCNHDLNPPGGFLNDYPSGSMLMKVRVWEYYLDQTDPNIPRLMRNEVRGTCDNNVVPPEVISEYVEDMQVALGIDTSGDDNIQPGEWVNTGFQNLSVAQLAGLRAIRLTLVGRTIMVPEVMAGRRVGNNDIYYRRPAEEDRGAGTIGTLPQYREVITEVIQLRNLRPFPMR